MSYNNYESFQGQPTGEQPGAPGGNGAPAQQPEMGQMQQQQMGQQQMGQQQMGQPMDTSGGGFPGPMAAQGGPQDQQHGNSKTTLW